MRKLLALVMAIAMIVSTPTAFSATPKVGGSCTKINQIQKSGSLILICHLNKGKKLWRKATSVEKSKYQKQLDKVAADAKAVAGEKNPFAPGIDKAAADKAAADKAAADAKAAADKAAADALSKTCVAGGICLVGNTGPGGGIVFYDAGSQQSWGRYLEYAPYTWSKSPRVFNWCNVNDFYFTGTVTDSVLRATLGFEIGKGKANTDLMVAGCTSGAAVQARAYRGGGKSDWFLPSMDELNELCKFANHQATGDPKIECLPSKSLLGSRGGLEGGTKFWSSSEYDANFAWSLYFYVANRGTHPKGSDDLLTVRPVRAF